MSSEVLISLLTFGGTLLLVVIRMKQKKRLRRICEH